MSTSGSGVQATLERVRCFETLDELSRAAAEEVRARGERAVAEAGRFTLALSGGATPRRLYELLAEEPLRDRIPWERTEVFWSDERAVRPDEAGSNYGMAAEALLAKLPLPGPRVHRIRAEQPDIDAAAAEYETEIAVAFGVSIEAGPPRLDLVLLGLGSDGHTASVFRAGPSGPKTRGWVVGARAPVAPIGRVTMTPRLLSAARCALFLVSGEEKAEALAAVLEGPADPDRLPAQRIRTGPGEVLWLVDAAAAARLRDLSAARGRLVGGPRRDG